MSRLRAGGFRPTGALAGVVESAWWVDYRELLSQPLQQCITPDGRVNLVVRMLDPAHAHHWRVTDPDAFCPGIYAAQREALWYPVPITRVAFGLTFYPGAAARVRDLLPGELPRHGVLPGEILGREFERVRGFAVDGDFAEALDNLTELVASRLREPDARDRQLGVALRRIDASGGTCDLATLAADSGYSERHWRRLFEERVGLPPKLYAEIRRIRQFLSLAARRLDTSVGRPNRDRRASLRTSYLAAALDACFYDQAHAIRSFRRFIGTTPAAYLAALEQMSDSYNPWKTPHPIVGARRKSDADYESLVRCRRQREAGRGAAPDADWE